jgi:hypothetical protein
MTSFENDLADATSTLSSIPGPELDGILLII